MLQRDPPVFVLLVCFQQSPAAIASGSAARLYDRERTLAGIFPGLHVIRAGFLVNAEVRDSHFHLIGIILCCIYEIQMDAYHAGFAAAMKLAADCYAESKKIIIND